jgi:hypothetical protein
LGGKKQVKENYSATEDSVFRLLESKIQIFLADAELGFLPLLPETFHARPQTEKNLTATYR